MIEADNLIYLQMQKTGCTRIAEIITDLCGGKPVGRKHGTLIAKPDKLVIGSIRNPWAWYVSLWAFGCEGKGMIRERLTRYRNVYTEAEDIDAFRQWLTIVYAEFGPLMTARYKEIYNGWVDTWIDIGQLPETLNKALMKAGYCVAYGDIKTACGKKSNSSHHLPYPQYYDGKKAAFVFQNDIMIFERHYSEFV